MTFAVLKGPQHWTPRRRLEAGAAQGRRPGRLPGGHVMDLAELFKAIILCPDCVGKFPAARCGYVQKRNLPVVRGRCDGCSGYTPQGTLLVHHQMANVT